MHNICEIEVNLASGYSGRESYVNGWTYGRTAPNQYGRTVLYHNTKDGRIKISLTCNYQLMQTTHTFKQGKSEGFDSCNRPSNLTQIWIQIVDFSARVTLKFDG